MESLSNDKSALVVGAGSIGAHLSRSLSKAGWIVTVIDTSQEAVSRFASDLYPARYGQMPETISVCLAEALDHSQKFRAMIVGTPPDSHLRVLDDYAALIDGLISVQKPLTTFRKSEIKQLTELEANSDAIFLAGFNHRVSLGALSFWSLLPSIFSNQKVTVVVDWLESWDGIMRAHPWLDSPADTYLGYTSRGGGALFEHSHGLDLGLLASDILGLGPLSSLSSSARLVTTGGMHYDESSEVACGFSNGSTLVSRQDVKTWPARKMIEVRSDKWSAVLECGTSETVKVTSSRGEVEFLATYSKNREEDFDAEVRQFETILEVRTSKSSLSSLSHGLRTAKISSAVAGQSLGIDADVYTKDDLIREGILNEEVF